MIEYPKIETLFERGLDHRVTDKIRRPEWTQVGGWSVTEKIDGTNIRVHLDIEGKVHFGGRTERAQVPAFLLDHLMETFPAEKMKAALWLDGVPADAVLFGEGYGPKIQKGGGNYRSDVSFRLFDVYVGEKWWLEWNNVVDVAAKLGITTPQLIFANAAWGAIEHLVRVGFASYAAKEDGGTGRQAEGIVARSPFFNRHGSRVMFKLKTKDFTGGRR